MAIFSQEDENSMVDYRAYDKNKEYRTIPYKLPSELENKIIQLMKSLNLNTGSLDFIKTLDNEFIFLEVNPVGQFGNVSKSCNYFLEKKVALYLAS